MVRAAFRQRGMGVGVVPTTPIPHRPDGNQQSNHWLELEHVLRVMENKHARAPPITYEYMCSPKHPNPCFSWTNVFQVFRGFGIPTARTKAANYTINFITIMHC